MNLKRGYLGGTVDYKNTNNPTFAKEMFMLSKASYPSSKAVALLILEEFVLASFVYFC